MASNGKAFTSGTGMQKHPARVRHMSNGDLNHSLCGKEDTYRSVRSVDGKHVQSFGTMLLVTHNSAIVTCQKCIKRIGGN